MWQVGVQLRSSLLSLRPLLLHLPPLTPAGGLSLDTVLQFLRTLNVPPAALVEHEKAVPPSVPKKTSQQQTKEQRCSQLRDKVDMTEQQLAKLSKRRETLEKEYMEAGANVEEKTRELAQLETELEEALTMQPTLPRDLKECFESMNVCATLIVSVFRSETLLGKVEVRMLALWPQVRPALVLSGVGLAPHDVASSAGERGGQDARADVGDDIGEIVRLREFEGSRAIA